MIDSRPSNFPKIINPGPYEAVVVSHLDSKYMGSLRVELLKSSTTGNQPERTGQLITAEYMNPFYGTTSISANTKNDDFASTQKSYGMWFVPPDVGTRVLVIFVEGNISRAFWMGCVQDAYMNHMTPDPWVGSTYNTQDQTQKLPVGEFNKKTESAAGTNPTKYLKPVNKDFESTLTTQGLLKDNVRGLTTSTSRREVPSKVFGISTPGPLDKRINAPRAKIGPSEAKANVFSSRLGGSSLIFDDGDDTLIRKGFASQTPSEYTNLNVDTETETGGNVTLPFNECVRLRTRTGHQILLHNTEDLIYIGNARGSTWIELTSNGKIDIFAEDSISIHTKNDFNFYADRDFNLECGRNVNIKANGRLNGDFNQNIHLRAGLDMKVFVSETFDLKANKEMKITTGNSLDIAVGAATKITSLGSTDIFSSSALKITSNSTIDVGASGNIVVSGSRIDLNGPAAAAAATAISAVTAPPLSVHEVPGTLPSIMKRVPMHEPWTLHENSSPEASNPAFTDRETEGYLPSEYKPVTEASQVSASAAHVAEIFDYDAVVPEPATGQPSFPETIVVPSGGINLTADFFAPSKYGKRTAENLNTLEPTVRTVFARAIKAFILEYIKDGWDMSVSECLRPLARSKALYDAYKAGTGPQAAAPGNSWHNYGAAADILIYKDGKWDSLNKLGAYTGFARQFLRTQGIHNNAGANDSGHFVPIQMPVGVPKSVKSGQITIAQIMSGEKRV